MRKEIKILVLGSGSFLGSKFMEKIGKEKCIGTYHNQYVSGGRKFDIETQEIGTVLFPQDHFTHAFILFGITSPDACYQDKEKSYHINVVQMKKLINQLAEWDIHPAFCSTEAVFDGIKGNYTEKDYANPILEYGKQKLEMENYILEKFPRGLVIRLSKIYGTDPEDGTLFSEWVKQLVKNTDILCANDQKFSPVYVDDAVTIIYELIRSQEKGRFHVSGNEHLSRFDMLNQLISVYNQFELYEGRVKECSLRDFSVPEPRPLDITMVPNRLNQLGIWNPIQLNDAYRVLMENYISKKKRDLH